MLRSLIKFEAGRVKISEFVEASAEQILSAVVEQAKSLTAAFLAAGRPACEKNLEQKTAK
jgi:hypothetical protein